VSEGNREESSDPLIDLLRSSLSPIGDSTIEPLVLYTSFGVVRGRIGITFAQGLINNHGGSDAGTPLEVIEINDATVEHYSNHLANATFDRLHVRLSDVYGFALLAN